MLEKRIIITMVPFVGLVSDQHCMIRFLKNQEKEKL